MRAAVAAVLLEGGRESECTSIGLHHNGMNGEGPTTAVGGVLRAGAGAGACAGACAGAIRARWVWSQSHAIRLSPMATPFVSHNSLYVFGRLWRW